MFVQIWREGIRGKKSKWVVHVLGRFIWKANKERYW